MGAPYSQQISGAGGTGPYTYAVTPGALPAGVTLSATGLLSGTPTAGGNFSFTVTATDANGCPGSLAYSLYINPFGMSFFDDLAANQLCFNPLTGAFQWKILKGVHAGESYAGTAVVKSYPGQMQATTPSTAPVRLTLYYYTTAHFALAQLYVVSPTRSCVFADSNTTNDPPCGGGG